MKRIELIKSQVNSNQLSNGDKNTVTITDNRTGKAKFKINHNHILSL